MILTRAGPSTEDAHRQIIEIQKHQVSMQAKLEADIQVHLYETLNANICTSYICFCLMCVIIKKSACGAGAVAGAGASSCRISTNISTSTSTIASIRISASSSSLFEAQYIHVDMIDVRISV